MSTSTEGFAVRRCKVCGNDKPIPPRKQKCLDCAPAKAGGKKKRRPPAATSTNAYERPGGLGFKICLEVDENTGQTDIRLEQWNATAGDWQRLWFNQLEAAELRTWLVEQLGAG